MTTMLHLERAVIELEAAKRMSQFFGWPELFTERIDLIRRATAKLRAEMREYRKANITEAKANNETRHGAH